MSSREKRIVQCPFCQTKFYVWLSLLQERRRVKCSSCHNIWFQDALDCEDPSEEVENVEPKVFMPPMPEMPPQDSDSSKDYGVEKFASFSQERGPMRFISNEPEKTKDLEPVPGFERDVLFPEEEEKHGARYRKRLSLVAFLIPLFLFVLGRDYVAKFIPSLSYVYKLMGLSLTQSQEGFEIRNTAWYEVTDKGIPSIVVSGELANMALEVKKSPAMRITMRGCGGGHPMDFAAYVFGDDKAEGPDGLCVVDQWTINASYDRLLPGQVVPFSTTHPYDERSKVEKVQIDFIT